MPNRENLMIEMLGMLRAYHDMKKRQQRAGYTDAVMPGTPGPMGDPRFASSEQYGPPYQAPYGPDQMMRESDVERPMRISGEFGFGSSAGAPHFTKIGFDRAEKVFGKGAVGYRGFGPNRDIYNSARSDVLSAVGEDGFSSSRPEHIRMLMKEYMMRLAKEAAVRKEGGR